MLESFCGVVCVFWFWGCLFFFKFLAFVFVCDSLVLLMDLVV